MRCLLSVLDLPDELDLSTTDLLFEGEDDRDEEEEEVLEMEEDFEVRVMGEVVLVLVVEAMVVTVVLSFLRLRTFLVVDLVVVVGEVVVLVVVVVVVVVVVEVLVGSGVVVQGLGAGRWMRFHQGLREVEEAGSVVVVKMMLGVAVVDFSVEVNWFHHLRLYVTWGNEKCAGVKKY